MIGLNEIIISLAGISAVVGILFSIQRRTYGLGQDLAILD